MNFGLVRLGLRVDLGSGDGVGLGVGMVRRLGVRRKEMDGLLVLVKCWGRLHGMERVKVKGEVRGSSWV